MDELSYVVKKLIDYTFTEEIYNKIIRNYCNIKQDYVPILFVYSIFATLLLLFVGIFNFLKVTKISSRKTTTVTVEQISENSDEYGDGNNESPIILSNNTSPLITIFQATTIKKLLSTINTNDENSNENGDDNNESTTTFPNNNNNNNNNKNIGPFSTIFQATTATTTTKPQPIINNINGNNSDENYVDDKNLLLNNFNNSINNTNITAIEKIEILRLRNAILTKDNHLGAWFLKYLDRINFKDYFMNVKNDLQFIIHYRNLLTNQKVSIANYMEYMRTICRTKYSFAKTQEYGYLTFKNCKELG